MRLLELADRSGPTVADLLIIAFVTIGGVIWILSILFGKRRK